MRLKYALSDAGATRVFITAASDIEAYFASKELAHSHNDARVLVESAIQDSQNEFAFRFQSKRNEIKLDLYKKDPNNCPRIEDLFPGAVVPTEKALGKLLLRS